MRINGPDPDPGGASTDPTRATAPELSRRAFVELSAAATVATPIPMPSSPVDDRDPAISVDRVTLRRPDIAVPAYAAWPVRATANVPSVVVTMHIWGVDATIREVVRRFAKAGFAAIAPDLYARFGAPSGDGETDIATFRPYAKRLEPQQYTGDLRAAALWLSAKFPHTKTGIIGFCMGGRVAMVAAIDNADVFAALCPFYGPLAGIDPADIRVPFCGSYGGRDTSIPAANVSVFRDKLHVPNDVRIYDNAGHAFADDRRASYVPSAAADAWRRTLAFLAKYLTEPQ